MPASQQPHAGKLLRTHLDSNLELILVYLFVTGIASLPCTIIGLYCIFKLGRDTAFPPEDSHVGWTPNPDHRGSFNLVWGCLSTIFTCVYVSVHTDVPDDTKSELFKADLSSQTNMPKRVLDVLFVVWRHCTKPVGRKVFWVLFNIFAPELMVLVALTERRSANSGVRFMHKLGVKEWTMQHAFFADMGGFKLPGPDRCGRPFRNGTDFYEWFSKVRPKLDYEEISLDIRDRCKANVVLKLITCAQAIWLLIQTVIRLAQHRPISELEVSTCSYIVCAVVTYACWLRKPYGVDGRITLHVSSEQTQKESINIYNTDSTPPDNAMPTDHLLYHGSTHSLQSSSIELSVVAADTEAQDTEVEIPQMIFPGARFTPFNRAYYNPQRAWSDSVHLAGVAGAIIGVIHGAPFWNSLFINTQGQWLWRACCGIQVIFPPTIALIAYVERYYVGILLWHWMMVMAFVYCVSRTVLFALIWLSFHSLPAGVYENVDWGLSFIPHMH